MNIKIKMKTNNIEHSHYLILRIHPSLAGGQSELGTLLAFALTAPCLGGELELANLQEMHFVRSIGEPERAQRRIGGSERKVLADARAAMHLYRPICNEACDPRRHHLDHADGLARRLVAHSVHQVRRARGLPDDLVRISAGIEEEADLLADLAQAMDKACAEVGVSAAAAAAAAPPASSVQQPRMFSLQSAPMTNGKVNRFLANSHAVAK